MLKMLPSLVVQLDNEQTNLPLGNTKRICYCCRIGSCHFSPPRMFQITIASEMGFLSQKIEKSQLVVGDHIYTWRSAYTYSHHGIFVGRNKVIHFTVFGQNSSRRSSGIFSSSSLLSSTCCNVPLCGFRRPESGVILSCLNCFLGEGSLYRFEYGVSWSFFLAKVRGGTCTIAESDPPNSVISRAVNLLQDGFGKYNVLMNNCEDFAIYCKTGSKVLNKNPSFRSAVRLVVLGFPKSN